MVRMNWKDFSFYSFISVIVIIIDLSPQLSYRQYILGTVQK